MQESETLRKDGGASATSVLRASSWLTTTAAYAICFVNSLQITVSTYLWQKMPNR